MSGIHPFFSRHDTEFNRVLFLYCHGICFLMDGCIYFERYGKLMWWVNSTGNLNQGWLLQWGTFGLHVLPTKTMTSIFAQPLVRHPTSVSQCPEFFYLLLFFVFKGKLYRCVYFFIIICWHWRCLNVIFEHLWVNASQPVVVMAAFKKMFFSFWQKLFNFRHKNEIITISTVVRRFYYNICANVQHWYARFSFKNTQHNTQLIVPHLVCYDTKFTCLNTYKLLFGSLESGGLLGGVT